MTTHRAVSVGLPTKLQPPTAPQTPPEWMLILRLYLVYPLICQRRWPFEKGRCKPKLKPDPKLARQQAISPPHRAAKGRFANTHPPNADEQPPFSPLLPTSQSPYLSPPPTRHHPTT